MKKSAKPKQRGVGRTLRIYEYEGEKVFAPRPCANGKHEASHNALSSESLDIDRALREKKREKNVKGGRSPKYSFRGHKYSIKRLSELGGINPSTIASRIRLGWSVEDACTKTVDAFHNGHKAKSE